MYDSAYKIGKHDLESITTLYADESTRLERSRLLIEKGLLKKPQNNIYNIEINLNNLCTHIFEIVTKNAFSVINFMYNDFRLTIFST